MLSGVKVNISHAPKDYLCTLLLGTFRYELRGRMKGGSKIKSLVYTEMKLGFILKKEILYYDCLTPKLSRA